jgi:hypothetical protein
MPCRTCFSILGYEEVQTQVVLGKAHAANRVASRHKSIMWNVVFSVLRLWWLSVNARIEVARAKLK